MLALASSSPRRRDLLVERGVAFLVVSPNVDESPNGETDPVRLASRLARLKAMDVLSRRVDGYVLAADTVVAVGGEILGKPTDDDDARRMLQLLSGSTHRVVTGFTAGRQSDGALVTGSVTTLITMRPLTDADIEAYIATREHEGKAGSYAIQETADQFVIAMEGPLDNVVGLPVRHALAALAALGLKDVS